MSQNGISLTFLEEFLQESPAGGEVLNVLGTILPEHIINTIYLSDVQEIASSDGVTYIGYVAFPGGQEFTVPNLDVVSLALGNSGTELVTVHFILFLGEDFWRLILGELDLFLTFNPSILRSVAAGPGEDDRASLQFHAGLHIDSDMNVAFTPFSASLSRAYVAGTNLIVSADHVSLDINATDPTVSFKQLTMEPPQDLVSDEVPLPKLTIDNGRIGRDGFWGKASANWDLQFDGSKFHYHIDGNQVEATLFGLPGGIRSFSMHFEQNLPVDVSIHGGLQIPYFGEPPNNGVDVRLSLTDEGGFAATLDGAGESGIVLRREDLLTLTLHSLSIDSVQKTLMVSGELEPLLMASDGLEWPSFEVVDLYIDADGRFKLAEAWLDLKELATLDLWGFHFELNRLGIGYEELQDRLWVDLSGSLRLIDQLPVGLGVEGFRLSWPQELAINDPPTLEAALKVAEQLEVKFDGVHLFYGVPGAVEFEGYIRLIKEAQVVGFAGDMALRVPATGLAAEAGLMVGMNFEEPPYPFLYLYFGIELPAGIPLGQSGLALKGALGLFGLNVTPDKAPEENWYYDWYKGGPIVGAHPTNKWTYERMALALGVGVTITTVDGYIKGVRGLLVLAIPGPIIIIEGRALVFDGLLPGEPPLRALAVFDGREGIAQFNIEAEAELIEDMLEAYGMLEAFFDFNDLTNWHLYLGQDIPRDRRIQANILKMAEAFLFKAEAYLMLDMVGAHTPRTQLGVFIGFKPPIPDLGPVHVDFEGSLEGDGKVTILPEQFSGRVALSARIGLKAFGVGLQMAAEASVFTEGPAPLKVEADVHVSAELPLPLSPLEMLFDDVEIPPLEVDANLTFSWELDTQIPDIVTPLSEVTIGSQFSSTGHSLDLHPRESINDRRGLADRSPVVELDARPIAAFGHEMNAVAEDDRMLPFLKHPTSKKKYRTGLFETIPTLRDVELYKHEKRDPWSGANSLSDWSLVSSATGLEPMAGIWIPEADQGNPSEPPSRRLQLLTDNPFIHASHTLNQTNNAFGLVQSQGAYSEIILENYPDLMACPGEDEIAVEEHCISFEGLSGTQKEEGKEWVHEGVIFGGSGGGKVEESKKRLPLQPKRELKKFWDIIIAFILLLKDWMVRPTTTHECLILRGNHTIRFSTAVRRARIRFCEDPGLREQEVSARVFAFRTARTLKEVMDITRLAELRHEDPDYQECRFRVPISVSTADREWVIETDEGFSCLQMIRFGELAIRRICYATETSITTSEQVAAQCESNIRLPSPVTILEPGTYYRMVFRTHQETSIPPEVLAELPEPVVTFFSGILNQIADKLGYGESGREDIHEVFFQTQGPPHNLSSYVKWTQPVDGASRVFRRDNPTVRFLRPYVQHMFNEETPQRLEILVRDARGRLVPGYTTNWSEARTPTLFKDEAIWTEHLNRITYEDWTPPHDPILYGMYRDDEAILEPKARYEFLVVGGEGGEILKLDWAASERGWSEAGGILKRSGATDPHLISGDPTWTDVDFAFEVKTAGNEAGALFRVAMSPRSEGAVPQKYYRLVINTHAELELKQFDTRDGSVTDLLDDSPAIDISMDQWVRVRVSAVANHIKIWVFDSLVIDEEYPVETAIFQGCVGLYARSDHVVFRNVRVRNAILHSVRFMTSGYEDFRHLMGATDGFSLLKPTITITGVAPPAVEDIDGILSSAAALASKQRQVDEALVDYRFDVLKGGRAELENIRLALREARSQHDALIRSLFDKMHSAADGFNVFYQPLADQVEIFSMRSVDGCAAILVRSPETLDLRETALLEGQPDIAVGRTEVVLRNSDGTTVSEVKVLHDADSHHCLLVPNSGIFSDGSYELRFSYHRDYGDEISENRDHQYDRPVESNNGSTEAEHVILGVTI